MHARLARAAAVLLAAIAGGACAPPPPPHAASAAPILAAAPPPPTFVDPERRAKLTRAYPKLDEYFAAVFAKHSLPGLAVGLVVDGELAWFKGYGVRDVDTKGSIDADTVFNIASITKPFTALAVLRLRDEGKLSLDEPAATYLPELDGVVYPTSDSAPITLRHLLTGTSGLPNVGPLDAGKVTATDEDVLASLRGLRLQRAPGDGYEYSSLAIAVAGLLVARVSGLSSRDYLKTRILGPLGMISATWNVGDAPREHLATPYLRDARGPDAAPSPVRSTPHADLGGFASAGGLYTSTREMARYLALQLDAWPARTGADAGPVRRSSRREMQQMQRFDGLVVPRAGEGTSTAYGEGLGEGSQYACGLGPFFTMNGGDTQGYSSKIVGWPEQGIGLVAMTNEFDPDVYAAIRWVDVAAILRASDAFQPRVASPTPALAAARDQLVALLFGPHYDGAAAARLFAHPGEPLAPVPRGAFPPGLDNVHKNFGTCHFDHDLAPSHAMETHFTMTCDHGTVDVRASLASTSPLVLDGFAWGIHIDDRYETDPAPGAPGDPRCGP